MNFALMENSMFGSPVIFWLVMLCLFVIIEMATVSLTSIWFAGGSLAALLGCLLHAPLAVQIIMFFTVSLIMLLLVRPFAVKYVKPHNIKTNYEELAGKEVWVTKEVNDREGTVTCNGLEWSAKSADKGASIGPGETAIVQEVRGVTLIVKKVR